MVPIERSLVRHFEPLRQDVEAAFQEAAQFRQKIPDREVSDMDAQQLREVLLKLKALYAGDHIDDMVTACEDAATALGKKEGEAGLQWISENLPPLYQAAMNGWAEVEPDAAFEKVVASQRLNPCSSKALTGLLLRKAGAGPETLATAVERVPWQLFLTAGTGQPGSLVFDPEVPDVDIRPWIESGVLRKLADQHVGLEDLFTVWSGQDPGGAIAGWVAWSEDDPRGIDHGLRELLLAGWKSEKVMALVDQAVANADPTTRARFIAATHRLEEPGSDFYEIVETFPHLHNLTKSPEEPGPEGGDE
ncbi:MAG: hypothetical protein JWO82_2312 [Akkermansiaceae bacterium]|nr:hypothetical protein [Akkermansiaceae bacterium]